MAAGAAGGQQPKVRGLGHLIRIHICRADVVQVRYLSPVHTEGQITFPRQRWEAEFRLRREAKGGVGKVFHPKVLGQRLTFFATSAGLQITRTSKESPTSFICVLHQYKELHLLRKYPIVYYLS